MASSPVPGPSSTMSNLLSRTPMQELEIVNESIEVLKRNVGLAQSNRLKAGRLRVERYEALKDMELEVDEADETLEEHRLVAESLRKDIDALLKVQKRWNNRLTVATEERIGLLSDAVQEKTSDLKQTVEEEAALKSKLEQSQCTCQSVQDSKDGDIVTTDAGAGDVTSEIPIAQDGPDATSNPAEAKDFENAEVGAKTFQDGGDLDSACVPNCDWHKISFELKSALEEKEVLDKDIKYLTDRVITLRQNRIAFTAEVTAARKKTEIKRRQLKKVDQKIQSCLKSKEKRLKALEAGKAAYKKAETSLIEADQQVRTVQQLLKHKMLEKTELEKRVERYQQTEELRKFSLEVKASIPVSFGDLYPGITENSAIEYLEKVARANAAARRKAEWTNEIDGLTIDFEDRRYPFTGTYRNTPVRVSPIRTESETHFCEDYRPPPMCFSSINTSSFKNFGLFKPSSSSYGWKKTFAKVPVLGVGLGSLKNFAVKFGNFLSYGKNIYPRTIVVNGVMYQLKDAKSAPERIYGPLTHDVWSRHIKDVRNFSQQTPNSFCQRLFRRTAPVTLGQGQPCPQTFQGQHYAQTYQGQQQLYQGQHYPQYFHGQYYAQQTLQGQQYYQTFQGPQYPQYFQSQYYAQTFQGQPNFQAFESQQYHQTYQGQL